MEMSIEEKVYQMFIIGYEGEDPLSCPNFLDALGKGLGGVIFFTQNIKTREQFKKSVSDIKKHSKTLPFLSIDQEGGRVERTLNLYDGQKYLCARDAAQKGEDFVAEQTTAIAKELKDFGLNMNFAPVLDVDTNPDNPVIAERSYSNNPEIVTKMGAVSAKTYLENGIIPVGKHFPGHGETSVDSHIDMPELHLTLEELEKTHILPFKALIKTLPAIMIAHIHYTAFPTPLPASISKPIIDGYLRKTLKFDGLVISDDMVMGGIKKFSPIDAVTKGIEAGVNMFIFRNSDEATIDLIEQVIKKVRAGEIDIAKIEESFEKIKKIKSNCC